MTHKTSIPYLDQNNINEYFEYLAEEIESAGIGVHRILVVGGAAIALKYKNLRSTVDIDMCFKEQNNLYQCCLKVAAKCKLPEDWINADVMHSDSFSYVLFDHAEIYREYGNSLIVYVADDLDMYCMKLVSFRPKDIQDMNTIRESLVEKGITVQDVKNNFNRLYGSEYLLKNDIRKLRFVTAQLGK